MREFKAKIGGWLLTLSLVLSLLAECTGVINGFWAGIPIWFTAILFLSYLSPSKKNQILFLFTLGLIGLTISLVLGVESQYVFSAIEANQKIVTMLIAVGFLQIVANDTAPGVTDLPLGKKSLMKTLVGVHLIGSVLNMSSVIIVGDKLSAKSSLTKEQGVLILRAFTICVFWSPFFASMGIALTSAPGSRLSILILGGLPVAIVALVLSCWQIYSHHGMSNIKGYPITWGSVWMPTLLALIVMFIHHQYPGISVVSIVTFTAIIFTLLWVVILKGKQGFVLVQKHIELGLIRSSGEVALFASAAMLASGTTAFLSAMDIEINLYGYGVSEAAMTMLVIIVVSMMGMHPFASMVLAGSLLAPHVTNPNVLALALLMGCSMSMGLSPYAGVQITIQSRYGISVRDLFFSNIKYTAVMFVVCVIAIYTCSNFMADI